jgi:hypothetical protein
MTTAPDALGMTSIYRFRSLTNNLNLFNQSKHVENVKNYIAYWYHIVPV